MTGNEIIKGLGMNNTTGTCHFRKSDFVLKQSTGEGIWGSEVFFIICLLMR